jgi:ATP-dependent DNA helicase PIF1
MELSREQQIAFNKYVQGYNIFITGPGGAGKSELIRMIYKHANSRFKDIHVTALTGCAALLLNCKAKTLHSWAGIGLANSPLEYYINVIKKKKFLREIWKQTDILIVDEVSMLSVKLFNMLNNIAKAIRCNNKPFGGIQLIFSGDFYQLPPVGNDTEPETQKICFESEEWSSVFHRDCQIELVKIFRQKDEIYANILNQIREGKIKKRSNELLLGYVGREIDPSLITQPTRLYPTKNKVEQINLTKMAELETELKTFNIKYVTDVEMTKSEKATRIEFSESEIKVELDFMSGNMICDKEVKLKIGCQVMCVINIRATNGDILICNGSQGIVKGFCDVTGYPKVKYNNGIERVMTRHIWESDKIPGTGVSQVPLILSWALTIHKSQGATLDAAEIDVGSGIFECGQTYVALSRVKSLDGLYLTSFDAKRIRINKKVKDFYESLRLYHESKETVEEISVPLVIAEEVPTAIPAPRANMFAEYEYVEAKAELVEEEYKTDVKVIKFN